MRTHVRSVGELTSDVRLGRLAGIAAARVETRCQHGANHVFVLTVGDRRRDRQVVQLALQRQLDAARCGCRSEATSRLS